MNKRHVVISISALFSIALGYALWGRENPCSVGNPSHVTSTALRAEGRVATYPGDDVIVGTDLGGVDLGGTLTAVHVKEGETVRKGQVLAVIDNRQERAAYQEATAHVQELEADRRFQETELRRNETLQASGITSRQSLDQARTQLDFAKARLEAAQATADRLRVNLSKLQILSPIDGVVVARFSDPGATVTPGIKLFEIAQMKHLRVEAEVDEFDLSRVQVGSSVNVHAEGFDASWKGTVEEIPSQVVGRRLKPQDPARPSDTRVLLVKIALEEPTPLKLGQRVELEIQPRTHS